jgi:hypothetical protein
MKQTIQYNDSCNDWVEDNNPSWKKTIIEGYFKEVEIIKEAIKKRKKELGF